MTRKFSLSIIFIPLCFLIQFVHCHPKLKTLSNGVMMFKRKENTTSNSIPDTSNASDGELKTLPFGWDTNGKYFTSVWDNKSKGSYTAKGDNEGKYEFKWQSIDDAIVGKGFRTGSKDRVFKYDGQFEVTGNGAYLALYGWSVGNQCVEYYVVDNWGQYPPCGSESKGNFESDGDTYTICTVSIKGPCVDGSGQNHIQFWSKRKTKRSSGTITFANHVSAWEKAGMNLGTLSSPQLLAVEAYAGSSGSATITISASGGKDNDTNSSSSSAGSGDGTNTTSPNSQGSSSSSTSQGGISSNGNTNTTSTSTQGGNVDSSGTPPKDDSSDDDSSKDAIGNGNNDVNPDASKDSSESSNGESNDTSQDYSADDSGDSSDDDHDDNSDDYDKDDSSPDYKNDSSADDESDSTPNGDPTSAKSNKTDASPPKDAHKDEPIVPKLCDTTSLKDDDKDAGINSNNNNTTTSRK